MGGRGGTGGGVDIRRVPGRAALLRMRIEKDPGVSKNSLVSGKFGVRRVCPSHHGMTAPEVKFDFKELDAFIGDLQQETNKKAREHAEQAAALGTRDCDRCSSALLKCLTRMRCSRKNHGPLRTTALPGAAESHSASGDGGKLRVSSLHAIAQLAGDRG
jgi:hypothetical protein